jgi:hypothetical protein
MWFQQDDFGTWAVTNNWLEDPNECNWYGISCGNRLDTISGENQSAVIQIFFNGTSSYVGAIPLDIGLLSNLQQFVITGTNDFSGSSRKYLQGTLPDSIGNWTDLTYFAVYYNALTGTLPNGIGKWTALTSFNVFYNVLTGTIPSSIGNWSLIEAVNFAANSFVGTLPDAICQYIDPDTDFLRVSCAVNCTCCTVYCFF